MAFVIRVNEEQLTRFLHVTRVHQQDLNLELTIYYTPIIY